MTNRPKFNQQQKNEKNEPILNEQQMKMTNINQNLMNNRET